MDTTLGFATAKDGAAVPTDGPDTVTAPPTPSRLESGTLAQVTDEFLPLHEPDSEPYLSCGDRVKLWLRLHWVFVGGVLFTVMGMVVFNFGLSDGFTYIGMEVSSGCPAC